MILNNSDSLSSRDVMIDMVRILTKQKTGLHLCHINAQSLRNKMDEFRLTFENSAVDVICISETWFTDNTYDSLISLNGYKVYRADRMKRGGGVAIYVRTCISSKLIAKSNHDDMIEQIFLELSAYDKKLLVGCVYRPHSSIPFETFTANLELLSDKYTDVVIAGDFNSNLFTDISLKNNMLALGFSVVNSVMPTHFSATCNTLLDLFFVNDTAKILLYDQISAACFSKHDLIFMTYNFNINVSEQYITYRDFKNLDYCVLGENISRIDWSKVCEMPLVDEQVDFIEGNIIKLFDVAVPLKTRILTSKSRPWFNSHIKYLINCRDLAHAQWKRFKTSYLKEAFHIARREVNIAIRRAKIKYYEYRFSHSINARETWKTIKDIGIGCNGAISDVDEDADSLNEAFVNIPRVTPDANFYNINGENENYNTFDFSCVSQEEVLKSILAVKSNATGCDNISPKFIKIILPYILPYITHLFNTIIMSSTYPHKWKHSKIIPLPKSGTEYRPIAILPFLSKVFEKLLHEQINSYINESGLLTENQSGFRLKHSCITTLIDVVEDVRREIDDNHVGILVLLDHSKAFDSVDHGILCSKLRHVFHFSSTSTRLIQSYLKFRSQSVFVKGSVSKPLSLSSGVPQGSILGPLLFTLYINDLPLYISHCKTHMYADDVQLFLCIPLDQFDEAICMVNEDLDSVYKWASANGLSLNPRKSKCLLIHRKSLKRDINLIINHEKIQCVSSVKNLGVIFNDTLTWHNHINNIVGSTYNKLRILWSSQPFTPQNIRILIAKTYLMPSLFYACEIFSNCDSVSRRKLNTVFNNICRYVYSIKKRDHISHIAVRLYGNTLDNLFKIRALVLLHKLIYTGQPPYLFHRLNFARSNRGNKVIPLRYKTLVSQRQFFVNVLPLWNSLPHTIQTTSNALQFKRILTNFFAGNS